ncbi:hypothetical protein SAY86_027268 [Trapa natans]|uniref:Uncharacterized protein n=1 Tax=Trapa natans TaxID=22666 RepID=A0AAN7KQY1_TRANT|nr:hypothetical protein SAY86_027268 [Trapa natans]
MLREWPSLSPAHLRDLPASISSLWQLVCRRNKLANDEAQERKREMVKEKARKSELTIEEKAESTDREMERGEKSGVPLVSSRNRGPATPVRLFDFTREHIISSHAAAANPSPPPSSCSRYISARKLAAALWEFHHYFPLPRMHRGVSVSNGGPPRLRRLKDKDDGGGGGGDFEAVHFMADPSSSSPHWPASASSLRRLVITLLLQHRRLVQRSHRAIQPMSLTSYGSSMEVTPYSLAVTPSSSLDLGGRSNYSLKTSTEVLKVLNHIWSLEEQHASNVSLIKAFKMELDNSKVRIKELLRDQLSDRREIDALMKQIAEDEHSRKAKEQEKIHVAIQSTRDELEDKWKLRKRSESLHRKLARELSDAKKSLSYALRDLENENRLRKLLEDLCDEFAIGIRDYEHDVCALKKKDHKKWGQESNCDRIILHVADSWLDERMQMKLEEAESGIRERGSIVEKLSFELETFLQAKKKAALRPREDRKLMEAVPFKEVMSMPQGVVGEGNSDENGSNCFELNRHGSKDEVMAHEDKEAAAEINIEEEKIQKTANIAKKKAGPCARRKACSNPMSLQVKFEERMTRVLMGNRYKNSKREEAEIERASDGVPPEISAHKPVEQESKNMPSSNVVSDFIKNQLMITGVGAGEASCSNYSTWRRHTSPVQHLMMMKSLAPDLDVFESSTKLPPVLKDSDIKAKLTEARSKGQKSRFKVFHRHLMS